MLVTLSQRPVKKSTIKPNGPWQNIGEVDIATQAWADWYNNRRLHGACGGRPPTEFEALSRWFGG
jgi:putative transposase